MLRAKGQYDKLECQRKAGKSERYDLINYLPNFEKTNGYPKGTVSKNIEVSQRDAMGYKRTSRS